MEVLHVIGKEMQKIKPDGEEYIFLDGDVYVIDNDQEIYIWIGKDCSVDEKTVGAWVANKLDNEERGGEPKVQTVVQGNEPQELKNLLKFKIEDGDTPGFLRHAELDMVNYKLFRVYTQEETSSIDSAMVEEVPLDKKSLNSNDVFLLDGNENIYLWVGKNANREERYTGQKLMQKIDSERNYLPLQYTIYEGDQGKSETAFYDFIKKAAKSGPVVSVEDKRELQYKPEKAKSSEEHLRETSAKGKSTNEKGFFAKLFGKLFGS